MAAGGPEVPPALKEQLAIGGRLIIPVGEGARHQTLIKLTRTSDAEFEEENLGAVAFVPLIGEQGWAEDGRRAATNHVPGQSRGKTLPELIADAAEEKPNRMLERFRWRPGVRAGAHKEAARARS